MSFCLLFARYRGLFEYASSVKSVHYMGYNKGGIFGIFYHTRYHFSNSLFRFHIVKEQINTFNRGGRSVLCFQIVNKIVKRFCACNNVTCRFRFVDLFLFRKRLRKVKRFNGCLYFKHNFVSFGCYAYTLYKFICKILNYHKRQMNNLLIFILQENYNI